MGTYYDCQLWTVITISHCKVCQKTSGHRQPSLSSVILSLPSLYKEKLYKTLKMINKDCLLATDLEPHNVTKYLIQVSDLGS